MFIMVLQVIVKDLKKHYKKVKAVDGVSFSIEKGEVFGFLGPNGAGKTTTIKMLSTLLSPSSGSVKVAGFDIRTHASSIRSVIGIVFQEPSLDSELTARENLVLHARLYNLHGSELNKRIDEVLSMVDLLDKKGVQVKTFSGGMKRRLELARGLLHRPKVLFLDEPTLGLDPQTRSKIWEYVMKLREELGMTILLTTHYMEEADFLCKRVAVIDHGRIIALDTPSNLKESLGGDVIKLKVDDFEKTISILKGAKKFDGHVQLAVKNADKKIVSILSILEKERVKVESVSIQKPSLNDVFLSITGREIREEKAERVNNFMIGGFRR